MLKDLKLKDYQEFVAGIGEDDYENELHMYTTLIDKTATKKNISSKVLTKKNTQFLKEVEECKDKNTLRFKIGDVEFGFITNLEEITFGEIIDLDFNLENVERHNRAMAVLYRPILEERKDKYTIIDYNGSQFFADTMKEMPLTAYFSAIGFFERLGMDLQNAIPSYSTPQKEKVAS